MLVDLLAARVINAAARFLVDPLARAHVSGIMVIMVANRLFYTNQTLSSCKP